VAKREVELTLADAGFPAEVIVAQTMATRCRMCEAEDPRPQAPPQS